MLNKPDSPLIQSEDTNPYLVALPKDISLYGRLGDFDLLSVIQMLCIGMHSGWLTIVGDSQQGKGRVAFQNGLIIYASTEVVVRFGTRLVKKGLLTSEQLNEALSEQKSEEGKRSLGAVLIEKGWVTRDHLQEELRDQTIFVVKTLLKWTQGYFYFEFQNNIDSRNEESTEGFDSDNLLLEVGQMFDEDSDRPQDNQFLIEELPEKDRDVVSFNPGAQTMVPMFSFPGAEDLMKGTPANPDSDSKVSSTIENDPPGSQPEQTPAASNPDPAPKETTSNVPSWLEDARKHEQAYAEKSDSLRRKPSSGATKAQEWIQDRIKKYN